MNSTDNLSARLRALLIPAVLFAVLACVPWLAAYGSTAYIMSLATRILILAIAAMSLDLLIGYAGLVSFGHAAFLGIGVYSVGILSALGHQDGFLQLGVALAAAAIFALVTGAIAIRTRGVYFIMITLAFGQMLYFVATALSQFGGDDGMGLDTRSQFFGHALLKSDRGLYYVSLGVLVAVYILLRCVVASRFGRVLAGVRENEIRMEAIGFRPFRFQLIAYVMSGMIAALAGCLLANQADFISPAPLAWQRSGELIFMVVLGGLGTLYGPILGAIAFLGIEEVLSNWSEDWGLVFGPLLVLSVFVARDGLGGLLRGRGQKP